MIDEKSELDTKAHKLGQFIGFSAEFDKLEPVEKERMKIQNDLMWQLSEVLGQRIASFFVPTK